MKRPFRTPSKARQDPSASLGRIPPRAHRHRVARTGHGLPGPEAASQRRRGPAPGCTSGAAAPSARRRLRRPVRPRCPLHAPRPLPAPLTPAGAGTTPSTPRGAEGPKRTRRTPAVGIPAQPGRKGRGARLGQPGEGRPAAPPARHEPPREAGVARRPRRPPPPSGAAPSLPGSAPGHRPRPHSPAEPSSSHNSHMAPRRPPRKLRGCSASPARRSLRRGAAVRGPARGRARGWCRRRRPAPLGGRAHPRLPPPGPRGWRAASSSSPLLPIRHLRPVLTAGLRWRWRVLQQSLRLPCSGGQEPFRNTWKSLSCAPADMQRHKGSLNTSARTKGYIAFKKPPLTSSDACSSKLYSLIGRQGISIDSQNHFWDHQLQLIPKHHLVN